MELPSGQMLRVPTPDETLRIKGYLIVRRNQVRDYLDVAALSDRYGIAHAADVLRHIDTYYSDQRGPDRRLLRPSSPGNSPTLGQLTLVRSASLAGTRAGCTLDGLGKRYRRLPLASCGNGAMTTALRFRNIDASPDDPVETWPFEGILAAVERGTLPDWRRLASAIQADPWGPVAHQVLEAVHLSHPYGTTELLEGV